MTIDDIRLQELTAWAVAEARRLSVPVPGDAALHSVSGDASFRRYFRLATGAASYIAVDAPPAHENSRIFVQVATLMRGAGVSAPVVHAVDYDKGFLLLEDFGDSLYLGPLLQAQARGDSEIPEQLYQAAIEALVNLQRGVDVAELPAYDRQRLRAEMALFETWFCEAFLNLQLTTAERQCIDQAFVFLEDAALSQPQVAVHRDYHSRNLLVLDTPRYVPKSSPGIIDFQDAVAGPYTYDLVSMLRDCYICWNPAQVQHWARAYLQKVSTHALFPAISDAQFFRDFDLMGLQRHLKVLGIFSRLCIRDKKPRYLADIPLVIRYFMDVSERYEELDSFHQWFSQTVLPVACTKLDLNPIPREK